MRYTSKKLEVSRGIVREQEARVTKQRKMLESAHANRHPVDDLQGRLVVMEQSLLAMTRFLLILELDLAEDLGIQHYQTKKRIRPANKVEKLGKTLPETDQSSGGSDGTRDTGIPDNLDHLDRA
jgi:hypothetical protein